MSAAATNHSRFFHPSGAPRKVVRINAGKDDDDRLFLLAVCEAPSDFTRTCHYLRKELITQLTVAPDVKAKYVGGALTLLVGCLEDVDRRLVDFFASDVSMPVHCVNFSKGMTPTALTELPRMRPNAAVASKYAAGDDRAPPVTVVSDEQYAKFVESWWAHDARSNDSSEWFQILHDDKYGTSKIVRAKDGEDGDGTFLDVTEDGSVQLVMPSSVVAQMEFDHVLTHRGETFLRTHGKGR